MCSQFGALLSERMIEFGILFDKIQKKEVIYNGILCTSKKAFLQNYFISLRNLMVLITGYTQTLQYVADIEEIDRAFIRIKKIFKDDAYLSYFSTNKNGIKILLIFELLHSIIEDFMFIEIKSQLTKFIGSKNGEKYQVCREVLDTIYELGEIAILNLSGLRINCYDIADSIVCDDKFRTTAVSFEVCPVCKVKQKQKKSSCGSGTVHVFMHEDMFKITNWLETYFKTIIEHHNNCKEVDVIFDYKLFEDHITWGDKCNNMYKTLIKPNFRNVYFINVDKVIFGEHANEINIVDYDSIKCSLEK